MSRQAHRSHGGLFTKSSPTHVHACDLDCVDDDSELAGCCMCGGPLVPLGTLGNRQHSRCRNCGMDQS